MLFHDYHSETQSSSTKQLEFSSTDLVLSKVAASAIHASVLDEWSADTPSWLPYQSVSRFSQDV
jgi:hypothetical protein